MAGYSEIVLALADIENQLETATGGDRIALEGARIQLQRLLIDDSLSSLSTAAAAVDAATVQLQKAANASTNQGLLDRLRRLSTDLRGKVTSSSGSVAEEQKSAPAPSSGNIIDEVQRLCIEEWNRFGQQEYGFDGELIRKGHQEGEDNYAERIGEYWQVGTNTTGVDGRDHDWFWSAAFVSWVFRTAGAGKNFRYSTQHSIFIAQAIRDRLNGTSSGFWGFRLDEHHPAVGDIVCWSRQDGIDFDHQNNGDYKGHTDIVIGVGNDRIWVIGGNVGNSVTKRPLRLNSEGYLQDATISGEVLFAVLQNRIPSLTAPTSTPTSPDMTQAKAGGMPKQGLVLEAPDGGLAMVDEGYDLLRKWEGCILYAYDDATKPPHRVASGEHINGTLTIGYGHTGSDVWPGLTWTEDQAEAALTKDVKLVSDLIAPLIKTPIKNRQFSALVSLTFNIGLGAFKDSSALKAINTGDLAAVPDLIARWHKTTINGVLVDSPGLANRRAAEIALWNKA
ncbi:DUF2272 domain-containing protein [Rhizobium sp. CNPSo 3464]|uniref:DUF2272 domain-containing protein n=1 Tax=Rhizobium sp. CNPSo 3464 TaxID=3021406 RepID=UPI00254C2E4D|nr:DUF2272 domain-containing protein [Rhizobium sp. CNPSo 3464]MDK4741300.1 DUF2272 domain-containing protein [Rhizobium sp. CNPSo 3464]